MSEEVVSKMGSDYEIIASSGIGSQIPAPKLKETMLSFHAAAVAVSADGSMLDDDSQSRMLEISTAEEDVSAVVETSPAAAIDDSQSRMWDVSMVDDDSQSRIWEASATGEDVNVSVVVQTPPAATIDDSQSRMWEISAEVTPAAAIDDSLSRMWEASHDGGAPAAATDIMLSFRTEAAKVAAVAGGEQEEVEQVGEEIQSNVPETTLFRATAAEEAAKVSERQRVGDDLRELYRTHAPAKVAGVEALLTKYPAERWDSLLALVRSKYRLSSALHGVVR